MPTLQRQQDRLDLAVPILRGLDASRIWDIAAATSASSPTLTVSLGTNDLTRALNSLDLIAVSFEAAALVVEYLESSPTGDDTDAGADPGPPPSMRSPRGGIASQDCRSSVRDGRRSPRR